MLEYPSSKGVEAPGNHCDVVQDQCVEHDPHHRPGRKYTPAATLSNASPGGRCQMRAAMKRPNEEPPARIARLDGA